jgi:AcrR family transcriptional regulator
MGVSRGSFYWHFADVGAFMSALSKITSEKTP